MRDFPRALIRIAASSLLVTGLVFALLEIALRIHNPIYVPLRASNIQLPVNRTFRETNVHFAKVDRVVTTSYNNIGLRGPNYPADPDRFVKIIAVGGSTTICVNLTDGKTWPDLVLRDLQAARPDLALWLNNAGQNGHSTFGHQILLQAHLAKLQPQYVLLLMGINDMEREDLNSYDISMTRGGAPLRDRLVTMSEVLSTAQVLYRSFRAHELGLNRAPDMDPRTVPRINETPAQRDAFLKRQKDNFLPAYRERVATLLATVRSMSATPILITQPAFMGHAVDPNTGVQIDNLLYGDFGREGFDISAGTAWDGLELYNDVLRELASSEGVMLIDAAREMPKDYRYYFDWLHYSNEGAARMASIISDQIERTLRPQQ